MILLMLHSILYITHKYIYSTPMFKTPGRHKLPTIATAKVGWGPGDLNYLVYFYRSHVEVFSNTYAGDRVKPVRKQSLEN